MKGVAFDSMLASYVLDPSKRQHGLDDLALEMLGHQNITYSDVAGKGAKQIGFDEVAIDVAATYAAEDSDITLRLTHALKARLKDETLKLYEELELPLIDVLADMEMTGVKVDREHLKKMSSKLSKKLQET